MNPYDRALLKLLAVALFFGAAIFRGRRKRGSSRAIATFAAGCTTGGVIAVALLLFLDAFMPPRAGLGLERIVMPIVTMFVSLIGSAILGGIVFLFEGRAGASSGRAVSQVAQSVLRVAAETTLRAAASRRHRRPDQPEDDWRDTARRHADQRGSGTTP